jgi:membrane-bound lytic murein transglycosylase D
LALPLLLVVLFATSCETADQKKVKVTPPPAPQIQQPATPPQTHAASAKPVAPAPAKRDEAQELIDRVEREYQTGQENYKAGHLEAAKANFDRAVSLLMEGPVDIKSDERLQQEFDKVVEGVNQLEMVALQAGDGFTEQRALPAPIDEANAVTFPTDPNVTAKAQQELKETRSDLPLVINEYVASYINYLTSRGRKYLEHSFGRGGKYRDLILGILKEEGVPQDLYYLAQAESGFYPIAVSRVGARGMWQFMHYTAPGFGLQHTWWVDDRQDPEKSTRAAARYLKDLHEQFGDWYLAIAAYNSGAGNVQRAVQRTGYADFWELYRRNVLPAETKNYVPIILAMTLIGKNPAQYGLSPDLLEPPLALDKVTTDYAVDLRLVAETIDVPVAQLADLNPSLLRMTTPKDAPYDLKLPAGTKEKFLTDIAAIPPDKRVLWRYHRVQPEETLATIAKKYRTSESAIQEVNNLQSDELRADSKLIIPVAPERRSSSAAYSKKPSRYKVRQGDTVLSVADDFGVPADRLRKWNRLKGNTLRKGRTLLIYKPLAEGEVAQAPRGNKRTKTSSAKKKSSKKAAPSVAKKGAPPRKVKAAYQR